MKSKDAKEQFAIANSSSWDKAKFNESEDVHESGGTGQKRSPQLGQTAIPILDI